MSNAVIEALYNGLPVLASDFPGMREIQGIVPSAPMRLFPDADEAAFVQALREQTASGESDALQEVRKVFSAQAIAERYEELFRGLLRRRARQNGFSPKNCSTEVCDV